MNRFEQYVPVELNYKPYIPDFDKWGKLLENQQAKYDQFTQTFNTALPEHIQQDTEEYKAFQTYLDRSKDEVKNAFLKDAKYGNQKLKNKMFELQKEMTHGIYKGLETRKQEYSAASQQLSEEIKDQTWYNQEYYTDQFKASPMNYDNGNFNHINPVTVSKDPERQKKLMEYAKAIIPPKIIQEAVRQSYKGELGMSAGAWIMDEEIVKQYMTKDEFKSRMRSYIESNPELQEDVRREAVVRDKRLTPEAKVSILAEHKQDIDEEILTQKEIAAKRLNETNEKEIQNLQSRYGLSITGKMDDNLREKINEDLSNNLNNLEQAGKYDTQQILYHTLIDKEGDALYPLVKNERESHIKATANPFMLKDMDEKFQLHKQYLDHKFRAGENALNRKAAWDRQQSSNQALQQATVLENMPGAVEQSPTTLNPLSSFEMLNKSNEQVKQTETGLLAQTKKFYPGTSNNDLNKSAANTYNIINSLSKTNIQNKSLEEQKKIFSQFSFFKDKTPAEALNMISDFKSSYEQHQQTKSNNSAMKNRLETSPVYKDIENSTNDFIDKYRGMLYDKSGKQLSREEASEYLRNNKEVYTTPAPNNVPGWQDLWTNYGRDIAESTRYPINPNDYKNYVEKGLKQLYQKNPALKADNMFTGEMFIDIDPKSAYYNHFSKSIIPALEEELKAKIPLDMLTGNPVLFLRKDVDGSEKYIPYDKMIKEAGFDKNQIVIVADKTGGKAGVFLSYGEKDAGKPVYSAKIGLNNTLKGTMKQIALSQYQTAKQANGGKGDRQKMDYWAGYIANMDERLPFYAFSNRDIPGEEVTVPTSNGITIGKLIWHSNNNQYGVDIGNLALNGNYYLAKKDGDGNWQPIKEDGNYIVSDDYNVTNTRVFEYELGSEGSAYKRTGSTRAINNAQAQTNQNEEAILDDEQN